MKPVSNLTRRSATTATASACAALVSPDCAAISTAAAASQASARGSFSAKPLRVEIVQWRRKPRKRA